MIERFELQEKFAAPLGLKECEFKRLGPVVALTGPNGGGKTRILKALQKQWRAASKSRPLRRTFGLNERGADRPMVYMAHRQSEPLDLDEDSKTEKSLTDPGARILDDTGRSLYMATHPQWPKDHPEEIVRAESIKSMMEALLGLKLEPKAPTPRNWKARAVVSGRRTALGDLSPGQKTVLRWIEMIHDEADDIKDAILLIDEPETSLHPGLLIQTFERLRELKPAQIWVATHSLPLLAHIGHENIFYVSEGHAEWVGNKIVKAQKGLLGGEQGLARLRDFLADGAALEFHHFAAQCLTAPQSVDLAEGDPQALGFVNVMRARFENNQETRVLDYAAGRARLGSALAAVPEEQRVGLKYHVFNDAKVVSEAERASCLDVVHRLAGDETGYSESLSKFNYDDESKMDIVILCNVLHEIPSADWPGVMKDIRGCLREGGHLMILEDQLMPIGELPHSKGFLVLHEQALGKLFGLTSTELSQLQNHSKDARLTMYEIPAQHLERCTAQSRDAAVECVRDHALEQVSLLRAKESEPGKDHQRGRKHAYYAMLYTNATLALK